MILTCPNCNSKFNIDAVLLGEKGRKVRCSSCEEVWFQESEEGDGVISDDDSISNETFEENKKDGNEIDDVEKKNIEVDDIKEDDTEEEFSFLDSDEVYDQHIPEEHDNVSPFKTASSGVTPGPMKSKKNVGFGIAASIFLLIFVYLLVNSTPIMRKHPSMQAFYALLGVHIDVIGKGLIFNEIVAVENDKTIEVSGHIINLETNKRDVPVIELSLRDEGGVVVAQWYIQPPESTIASEQSLPFRSVYYKEDLKTENSDKYKMRDLQIRFVLLPKIDAVDDGNIPALHQGDSDHRNAHEGS